MENKICSKCKIEKLLENFVKKNNSPDGCGNSCKQCHNERSRKYRIKHRENIKEYYIKNKEKKQSYLKEYYIENREKQLSCQKKYYVKNKGNRTEYKRNRKLNNPIYKLSINVRNRLRKYLKAKSITKNKITFDIVGCSPPELKDHISKQFVDGMSWDNYSFHNWHIDHIIPLSSAKTEEEIYKLCHYTNLQPLWAKDNLAKSNKLDYLYEIDKPKI